MLLWLIRSLSYSACIKSGQPGAYELIPDLCTYLNYNLLNQLA
jgi:hypothetical protein